MSRAQGLGFCNPLARDSMFFHFCANGTNISTKHSSAEFLSALSAGALVSIWIMPDVVMASSGGTPSDTPAAIRQKVV